MGLRALPVGLLRHDGDDRRRRQAGRISERARARCREIRKPLLVDSLAAIAGGAASTSSATTYIESGAGVAGGGRTGWVAVVCGALFFPFIFFAPIIGMVPPQATRLRSIIVGYLMISALTEAEEEAEPRTAASARSALAGIDFHDLGDRAAGGADDHADAVHLLDHERDRLRLHRLRR